MLHEDSIKNFTSKNYDHFDTQRSRVYSLDHDVVIFLGNIEKEFGTEKLCQHPFVAKFNNDKDIIGFTNSVLSDLMLSNVQVFLDENKFCSSFASFLPLKIVYAGGVIKCSSFCDNLETAIHEISHIVTHVYFGNVNFSGHGSLFVYVLRYLLDKYQILSINDFNNILIDNPKKISIINDLVFSKKVITNDCFEKIVNNPDNSFILKSYFGNGDSFYCRFLNKKENKNYVCINHNKINEIFLISYDAFPYQNSNENKFLDFKIEDLLNLRIYTSIYIMDDSGFKVTSRRDYFSTYGFVVFNVEKVFRKDGTFYYDVGTCVKNGFYEKKDALYELKKMTYHDSLKKYKVKKVSSFNYYLEEKSLLISALTSLNKII